MTKHIAVMGSGEGTNFQAIANFFKDKDVKITCLSDNLNAKILKRAEDMKIEHRYLPFEETAGYLGVNNFDLIVLAGYMRILPDEVLELGRFINIHPSLLPAFKGKDAIRRAFFAGVKVSGVTVHWVSDELDGGKIIAQYPVLIGNLMHFDEFESEIHRVEHILYPLVVDKLLKDEVFDFSDMMTSISNCEGCGRCH